MKEYLDPVRAIRDHGNTRGDRTGTGTRSLFGLRMEFDLNLGLPLLTSKKVFTRGLIKELCWIIAGDTNNETLVADGVHIWDEWALPENEYVEVNRTPVELVAALAAKLEKTPQEALDMLQAAEIEDKDKPLTPGVAWGGHRILREHEIVLTKQVVAFPKGDLGPVYGEQWRKWRTADGRVIDQLAELIEGIKTRPWSRRHVISAWNVADLPDETVSPQENVRQGKMALAPCHAFFQFYVEEFTPDKYIEMLKKLGHPEEVSVLAAAQTDKSDEEIRALMEEIAENLGQPIRRLSCQLYQRSADFPLGVPFNIASYAIFTHMIAQVCGMGVDRFIWVGGDCHIYSNQWDGVNEQLTRDTRKLPRLILNQGITNIDDFKPSDIVITGYDPHPAIVYPRAAV